MPLNESVASATTQEQLEIIQMFEQVIQLAKQGDRQAALLIELGKCANQIPSDDFFKIGDLIKRGYSDEASRLLKDAKTGRTNHLSYLMSEKYIEKFYVPSLHMRDSEEYKKTEHTFKDTVQMLLQIVPEEHRPIVLKLDETVTLMEEECLRYAYREGFQDGYTQSPANHHQIGGATA